MASGRTPLSRWRCRRLRARLVEAADGRLAERRRATVDRHLAACAACAAALAALREVPPMVRESVQPPADEAFWQRQRQDIMRAIRRQPEPRPRLRPAPAFGWRVLAHAAVVVCIALAGYRLLLPPARTAPSGAGDVAALDAATVVALADVAGLPLSESGVAVDAVWLDDQTTADVAAAAWVMPEPLAAEAALGDLTSADLEALEALVGDLPG